MVASRRRGRWWKAPIHGALHALGYQLVRYERSGSAEDTTCPMGASVFRDVRVQLDAVPHPVVFDVGGNAGQSIAQLKQVLPTAEIHSFEPSASTFAVLSSNAGSYPDVHLVNAGVGAVTGSSTLFENENSETSSFLRPLETWWGEVVAESDVDVVALDDYCAAKGLDHIDLLKTDTQGFELEVLKGARGLMQSRSIRLILLEVIFAQLYEGAPSFDVIFRLLSDNGFELVSFYDLVVREGRLSWGDALFALSRDGSDH